jgi:pimeloyl-ACP methyl ester carboxylesterase
MPVVAVNGIQVYYELHGAGEPLVVIPGMTIDVSEIGAIIEPLARHNRVLAFDNRGAGRSEKPDVPYTIAMMASDTWELMRAVGIDRANVLGISLGGRIALMLALEHPDAVAKLVLISTSARVLPRTWRFRLLGLVSSMPILRGKYPQPRYAFIRQRDASTGFDCTARLPAVAAPTLILHGKRDKTAPYALAEELHHGIRGSKLLTFAGGHLFFLFRERQPFLDAVADFMAS